MRAPDLFQRSSVWFLVAGCGFLASELITATPVSAAPLSGELAVRTTISGWSTASLSQGFGKPKTKGKTTTPEKKKDEPEPGLPPELARNPEALPPDYTPPPTLPADVALVKEVNVAEFSRTQQGQYQQILVRGNLKDDKDRALLRTGIIWRLSRMTQKTALEPTEEMIKESNEKGRKLESVVSYRQDIEADLRRTINTRQEFQVRDEFLAILCQEGPKLLDNNRKVRVQVSILLSNLNSREEDNQRKTPAVPCFQAVPVLLKLIADTAQHYTVKIHPLHALARACQHTDCPPIMRFDIMEGLTGQLVAAKRDFWWYGMRVADAMGNIGNPDDRDRQPAVVKALLATVADKEYHLMVRAHAANSIGRLPLDSFKKVDTIAIELVKLGDDLAEALGKNPSDNNIRECILQLYLTFVPATAADAAKGYSLKRQCETKSGLAPGKKTVDEAYEVLKPLFPAASTGGTTTIPVAELQRTLKSWLAQRAAPGEKPAAVSSAPAGG